MKQHKKTTDQNEQVNTEDKESGAISSSDNKEKKPKAISPNSESEKPKVGAVDKNKEIRTPAQDDRVEAFIGDALICSTSLSSGRRSRILLYCGEKEDELTAFRERSNNSPFNASSNDRWNKLIRSHNIISNRLIREFGFTLINCSPFPTDMLGTHFFTSCFYQRIDR